MINVVLMAGKGQRFTDAGYTIPKPLLPIDGKPMIVRAVESMPRADKWIFVIRDDYEKEQELLDALRRTADDVTILVAKDSPSQLNSALFAREYYNNDDTLFIGACDFGMKYREQDYLDALHGKLGDVPDVISWSFTQEPNLTKNPQAYGWLKQDEKRRVHGVSVKIPVSNDPFHDFAITGSFTFRTGKIFIKIAEEVIRRDIRIKNEFYIDSTIGLAVEMGYNVVSFPVAFTGWGTPAEYEQYHAKHKTNNSQ